MNNRDNEVRHILVYATIALMVIALVACFIPGTVAVLGTETILGIATHAVFRYYFTKEK